MSSRRDRRLHLKSLAREELSNGYLDWRHHRTRALHCAVDSVLHRVHPSREGTRAHLVHMVEAEGSLRHWPRHWWNPTDSTGRGRGAWSSLLIACPPYVQSI